MRWATLLVLPALVLGCTAETDLPEDCLVHEARRWVPVPRGGRLPVLVLLGDRSDLPDGTVESLVELERKLESGFLAIDEDPWEVDLDAVVEMELVDIDSSSDLDTIIDTHVEPGVGLLVIVVTAGDVPPGWAEDAAAIAVMADYPRDPRVRLLTVSGVPEDSHYREPSATLLDPRMQPDSTAACVTADGTALAPSRGAVLLAQAARDLYVASWTLSLCSHDWPAWILEVVVEAAGASDSCLYVLGDPSVADPERCHLYEVFEDPIDCETLPGREPAPTAEHPHRCRVRRVEPSADGPPVEPGWWVYHSRWCGPSPELRYSGDVTLPERGVSGQLECLLTVGECRGL